MVDRDSKVLGYVAFGPGRLSVLCFDEDACIIVGSAERMRHYIINTPSALSLDSYTISKARYGIVRQAMAVGALYAFDLEAFERFRPLAALDGHDLSDIPSEDDTWPREESGIPLICIHWL